jgi:hypothetical protein
MTKRKRQEKEEDRDMREKRKTSLALIAVLMLAGTTAISTAASGEERKPDATVKLSEGSVAAGIGWSWGRGTLNYKGKLYHFKVEGLSVGEAGYTHAKANGKVYNLKNLDDFDGVYAVASAGVTVEAGKGATAVVNDKKVEIVLTSVTKGVSLKLAAEGVKVKLEK